VIPEARVGPGPGRGKHGDTTKEWTGSRRTEIMGVSEKRGATRLCQSCEKNSKKQSGCNFRYTPSEDNFGIQLF
jgi:hypothetical protein